MENPRSEKVAVVDEVRSKLSAADAVLLTEYRGLRVSELAQLRTAMRAAGGEYRVYKNTLVRLAARDLDLDLEAALTGPTALTFVTAKSDGSPGDVASVAKAITDFAKGNPLLVLKGGILGDTMLDASGAKALASLPTASEIYARLAGAVNNGARGLASVISGVHRSVAYVLQAAIDAGAFAGDAPAAPSDAPEATDADSGETAEAEAPVAEAEADAPSDTADGEVNEPTETESETEIETETDAAEAEGADDAAATEES